MENEYTKETIKKSYNCIQLMKLMNYSNIFKKRKKLQRGNVIFILSLKNKYEKGWLMKTHILYLNH